MASPLPEKSAAAAANTPPPSYETSQQQAQYPPVQQHVTTTTTTIISQPLVPLMYGTTPVAMTCPHCQAQICTRTDYQPGMLTWLACGGIAFLGGWLGCCLIPFCLKDTQDVRHVCPNCNNFLGVYRRM